MHYKVIVVTDDPLCETLKQTDCSTSTATYGKNTNLQYLVTYTVLLNSDPEKKKLLHPKSIPTSQCYYCTLIFIV